MRLFLVLALLIAILAVIFSFQNATTIVVALGLWTFQASLALVLLATLGIGIIIGLLVSVPSAVRKTMEISKDERYINQLKADLNQQLEIVSQQQKRIDNLEKHLNSGNPT